MHHFPLPLKEITGRLEKLGYELKQGPEGLLTFTKVLPPYFPHATSRRVAYHIPKYYAEPGLSIPYEVVDDILLHLFLSEEEEEQFWNEEERGLGVQ